MIPVYSKQLDASDHFILLSLFESLTMFYCYFLICKSKKIVQLLAFPFCHFGSWC